MTTQNIPQWMLEGSLRNFIKKHPNITVAIRLDGGQLDENVVLKIAGRPEFVSWRVIINSESRLHHIEIIRVIENVAGDFSRGTDAQLRRMLVNHRGWITLDVVGGKVTSVRYRTDWP